MDIIIFLIMFVSLLIIGAPLYLSMISSAIMYILLNPGISFVVMTQKMASSVNSFPLLAIPLFIFAGQLMNTGGITNRIFTFAKRLVGHHRGGLGYVNVLASLIFSGMSGSAMADVGGLGQIEIDAMRKEKFDDDFTIGITAASGTVGPIVPPSIPFVVYGSFASVSVGALFMGGILPGVLTAFCIALLIFFFARKRHYPRHPKATLRQILSSGKKSSLALLTPIIIIGGMWTGWFTPTEAAFVSICYALLIVLFIYKDFKLKKLKKIFDATLKMMAPPLLIVVGATLFGWIITYEKVDLIIVEAINAWQLNTYTVLLLLNLVLFFLGMFIDTTAAILIVLPIFAPIAASLGINEIHLGVMIVFNLMIGLLTPPVGFSLHILSTVTGHKVGKIAKMVTPWLIPLIISLILITFIPAITLAIPRWLGFVS